MVRCPVDGVFKKNFGGITVDKPCLDNRFLAKRQRLFELAGQVYDRNYISFPVDATDRSLTYDLVKLYDIRINILKAEIQAGKSGNLLVELEADTDKLDQGIAYLIENGVTVSPVSSKVSYDASLCIDCGNCVSACFSHALTIGAPDWKLHFNPEKCIACKLCLKACPLKLFRIEFAEA